METVIKDNMRYVISIKGNHLKKILTLLRDNALDTTFYPYKNKYGYY